MKISENVKKVLVVAITVIVSALLLCIAAPNVIKCITYLCKLLSPIIFGYIFSKLINPFADKLQNRLKIPRTISVIFMIIIVLGALGGLIGGFAYNLISEITDLAEHWSDMFESLVTSWRMLSSQWSGVYEVMPGFVQNALSNIYAQSVELMANAKVISGAQDIARSVPKGVIWTIIFVLSMFFMVTQKESVSRFIRKLLGEKITNRIIDIRDECKRFMWGYVKAQLILMIIIFFIISAALTILHAPYAIVVASVTAVLDALPFFGSGFTLWPLSIMCFITGDVTLGIGYIVIYLIIMLLRRFLEPKLVSDNMGLHPVVTLAMMYIGYLWWGIIGLITGPILFMILLSIYRVGVFDGIIKIMKRLWSFTKKETKIFVDYLDRITK